MNGRILFSLLSAGLILSGCVDEYGRVRPPDPIGQALFNALDPSVPVYRSSNYVVASEMPPGRYETRTGAPAGYSDPIWINGFWGWGGSDWVWVPGRWVERPHPDASWIDGRYYEDNGLRYWRSGYWQ